MRDESSCLASRGIKCKGTSLSCPAGCQTQKKIQIRGDLQKVAGVTLLFNDPAVAVQTSLSGSFDRSANESNRSAQPVSAQEKFENKSKK
jgi:hypothetical protein